MCREIKKLSQAMSAPAISWAAKYQNPNFSTRRNIRSVLRPRFAAATTKYKTICACTRSTEWSSNVQNFWRKKLTQNATTYDAAYVALAEALEATLLTCDAKLSRAPGVAVRAELVP